jgi:hypothetical protein
MLTRLGNPATFELDRVITVSHIGRQSSDATKCSHLPPIVSFSLGAPHLYLLDVSPICLSHFPMYRGADHLGCSSYATSRVQYSVDSTGLVNQCETVVPQISLLEYSSAVLSEMGRAQLKAVSLALFQARTKQAVEIH